jgi:phosphoglycerate dehydrogenase-like enzyme
VTVLATDARRSADPAGVAELHPPRALDDLLPPADFVILTVPHTPATESFFDRARFRRMKRTAFFINIGRGMTTRLDDLSRRCRPARSPAPHSTSTSRSRCRARTRFGDCPTCCSRRTWRDTDHTSNERRFEIVADNCRAFAAGQPLRNEVDKASWF